MKAVLLLAALLFAQAFAEVQQGNCAVCEMVVQVAENYVLNNATESEIQAAVDQLCSDLPSPYSSMCKQQVNSYLPQIIEWLEANEPPSTVCAQLGLCGSAWAVELENAKRDVEQSPCSVCEIVAQVVESQLENNATVSEIQQKLDSLCGDLPNPYNGECTLIVNAYLPQIIQWIENNETPQVVCQQISLCPNQEEVKRDVEQSPCSVCEIVAQVVENQLDNNATESEIQKKLDSLCSNLPDPYNGECTLIVNAYLTQMIQWIENNETPQVVCQQLSLCPKQEEEEVKRDIEQNVCAVCELVVQVAESYVENNATQKEIEQALEAVCKDLPSPYKTECLLIAKSYLPQIIQWLENNEPPHTFCIQLNLCAYQNEVKREIEQTSAPCTVCTTVVQVIENYLNSNATFAEIEAKLDDVCNTFPAPYNGECVLTVAAYAPQIVAWIDANEPPATFCQSVGLCPN
jgi:saposin